ncbi:voltage-dependent anion-selective channel protein 2-like isoform X2 [Biomphalaria glabrata]|uniref:Voltage-dependent anion-selective channel protein 2-like isoform X2 n=1 Tax=Biomphalaria glabrata TaxID=6526 RepID=A0A2C9JK60_BIOGL|nr:voltage-dependent anion-selective channel protein 2-like isoform X2 [Biomphalaria glabrata]
MAPPSFSDLGKAARDVFSKGFNWGFYKLDAKTKTKNNVEFKAGISSNRDSGKVSGSLETKYKWSEYGLTFTEKWNTDNVLNTEIKIEDQLAEGLELTFDTSFAPSTGKKSGKIKSAYSMDYVHLNCDVDFDFAGPTIHGAAVLGYEGWLAGYQLSFDSSKSKLTRSNFGFGYTGDDFSFTTFVNEGQEFVGSIHQKVTDSLEAAVNLSWTAGTGNTSFAVGGKYKLDDDASISLKVNNQSHVGIGYTQTLRDDLANGGIRVKMTMSALIDGKNINQGGHKVGLGIDFEA